MLKLNLTPRIVILISALALLLALLVACEGGSTFEFPSQRERSDESPSLRDEAMPILSEVCANWDEFNVNILGSTESRPEECDELENMPGAIVEPLPEPVAPIQEPITDPVADHGPQGLNTVNPTPWPSIGESGDYDADDDRLIEISTLAQLDAVRFDPDGDALVEPEVYESYFGAFPDASEDMGCPQPSGCSGYELVNNLDFDTDGDGTPSENDEYWNEGLGWAPLPEMDATFDGNNYIVSNLYINDESLHSAGLFGANYDTLMNIRLEKVSVQGGNQVGALVGRNSGGSIVRSRSEGKVKGSISGGLVGYNTGFIEDSESFANVSGLSRGGEEYVGGLVGANCGTDYGGTAIHKSIVNNAAHGNVSGGAGYAGGLVGYNSSSCTISNSKATGNVTGAGFVGGLAGGNEGSTFVGGGAKAGVIENSSASGNVSVSAEPDRWTASGGLVGTNDGYISMCQASGNVSGPANAGGLVGIHTTWHEGERSDRNFGTISNSAAQGNVEATGDYAGGLVGRNSGKIRDSVAEGEVKGEQYVGGLVGLNEGNEYRFGLITGSAASGDYSGARYRGPLAGANDGGEIVESWGTGAEKAWTAAPTPAPAPTLTSEPTPPPANEPSHPPMPPTVEPTNTPTPPPTSEPAPAPDPIHAGDRAALVKFYEAAGGAGWTNVKEGIGPRAVADERASMTGWHGVTVDATTGRVTGLALPGNNLVGTLPPELGLLSNLTYLDLSGNSLNNEKLVDYHSLEMLGNLIALTHLDLSENDLGGALPPELGWLTNLTYLDLSGNRFRGDISRANPDWPIEWHNLSQLTHLDLSNNKRCGLRCRHGLSGWIPSALSYGEYDWFPNLVYLDLSGNKLQGGAQSMLEKSYPVTDSDRSITVNLSDNPWSYEPAEKRAYWTEFQAEMIGGFVDLATLAAQQKYKIPSLDPNSLRNYAVGKGSEKIQARAVIHIAESGKYANAATWLVRGAKVVGTVGTGVGWIVFALDAASILNQMLELTVNLLETGPGKMIERTSSRFLGEWWSCALANGLENAPVAEINKVCGEW